MAKFIEGQIVPRLLMARGTVSAATAARERAEGGTPIVDGRPLPVGAFVRIVGMNNLDDIGDDEDESRTYRSKSYPRKLITITARLIRIISCVRACEMNSQATLP